MEFFFFFFLEFFGNVILCADKLDDVVISPDAEIVDVLEKGYKLGDKIIRFPKVVVGN